MKKLCVLFPGIGYQFDRSLLYYPAKMAEGYGYEIQRVNYSGFPSNLRGDEQRIREASVFAFEQAKYELDGIDWNSFDQILFISKSIGTIVAAMAEQYYDLKVRHVLYTPFKDTFAFKVKDGIAFHGTADPWVEDDEGLIKSSTVPMNIIEGVNHSLEGKQVLDNIDILKDVLKKTDEYIRG